MIGEDEVKEENFQFKYSPLTTDHSHYATHHLPA